MLEDYARLRRADAFAGAFGTHALEDIFSGPAPVRMLAGVGMRGVGYIADNWPKLKDAFRRQADQGLGPPAGLFSSASPNAPDAKKGR